MNTILCAAVRAMLVPMTRLAFAMVSIGKPLAAALNLGDVMQKLGAGVMFAGIVVAVWGVIQLGLSLTQGGGGQQTGTSVMFIVGGAVIAVAGFWLKNNMDTSWADSLGGYISPELMRANLAFLFGSVLG